MLGQHLGGSAHQGTAVAVLEGARQVALLVGREVARVHQLVDEEAQPQLGRHAARRGVRLVDETEVGELRHGVADARGRERDRQQMREGARAHGARLAHVGGDHGAEHHALALAERQAGRLGSSLGH